MVSPFSPYCNCIITTFQVHHGCPLSKKDYQLINKHLVLDVILRNDNLPLSLFFLPPDEPPNKVIHNDEEYVPVSSLKSWYSVETSGSVNKPMVRKIALASGPATYKGFSSLKPFLAAQGNPPRYISLPGKGTGIEFASLRKLRRCLTFCNDF